MKWILRILGVVVAIAATRRRDRRASSEAARRLAPGHLPPAARSNLANNHGLRKIPRLDQRRRARRTISITQRLPWLDGNRIKRYEDSIAGNRSGPAAPSRHAHRRSKPALGRHMDHRNHARARRFRNAHHGRRLRQQPAIPLHGPLRFRLREYSRFLHEIVRRKVRRASHTSKLN